MADDKEIISAVLGGQESWKAYIDNKPPNKLRAIQVEVERLLENYTQFLEDLQCAGTVLECEIKRQNER